MPYVCFGNQTIIKLYFVHLHAKLSWPHEVMTSMSRSRGSIATLELHQCKMDSFSWRMLLPYMCVHNSLPFVKHLTVVVANLNKVSHVTFLLVGTSVGILSNFSKTSMVSIMRVPQILNTCKICVFESPFSIWFPGGVNYKISYGTMCVNKRGVNCGVGWQNIHELRVLLWSIS